MTALNLIFKNFDQQIPFRLACHLPYIKIKLCDLIFFRKYPFVHWYFQIKYLLEVDNNFDTIDATKFQIIEIK